MSSFIGPRLAALFSAAFAVFLFLAVAAINVPQKASDQEMVDWWSKSGNQMSAIASMYLMVTAAIALVVFLNHFRERLNGDRGTAGNAMFAVGSGAFTLLLASAAVRGVIGVAVKTADEPLPGPELLRYIPQVGYSLVSIALIAIGASLVLAWWAIKHTKAFPAWFAWTSLVTGVLLLALTPLVGPFVIPVVLLWAFAASAAMWRSQPASNADAAHGTVRPAGRQAVE